MLTREKVKGEFGLTAGAACIPVAAAQIACLEQAPEVGSDHLVTSLMVSAQAMAWAGLTACGLDPETAIRTWRRLRGQGDGQCRVRPC